MAAVIARAAAAAAAAVAAVVTTAAGCKAPSYHACAIACGEGGSCPSGFRCADDAYCHAEAEYPVESCAADAAPLDAAPPDATPPDAAPLDATPPDAVPATCDFGTASNSAAVTNPQLFAQVIPFAGGASLPPGTYVLSYVDGCARYAPALWWSIHGHADGDVAWWLVGASSTERVRLLPGTVGLLPGTAGPGEANGFERFDDCVAANLELDPITFEHAGGPLGIFQADIHYADNVSGEDGRNPRWRLVLDAPCPPDA